MAGMISAVVVDNDVGRALVELCGWGCSIAAGRRRWMKGAAAAEMKIFFVIEGGMSQQAF
jgi:hypothetical protein